MAAWHLAELPCGVFAGCSGFPDSDDVLKLHCKLASLLSNVIAGSKQPKLGLAFPPSAYLSALRWVCVVLGAHDAKLLCDELSPILDGSIATGWEHDQRPSGSSSAPTPRRRLPSTSSKEPPATLDMRLAKLESSVQAHLRTLVGLSHEQVASLGALRLPTLRELPNATGLTKRFLMQYADVMTELREMLAHGEWQQLLTMTHNLKSGLHWVGAHRCGEIAAAIEALADHLPAAEMLIDILLERLAAELPHTFNGLHRFLLMETEVLGQAQTD